MAICRCSARHKKFLSRTAVSPPDRTFQYSPDPVDQPQLARANRNEVLPRGDKPLTRTACGHTGHQRIFFFTPEQGREGKNLAEWVAGREPGKAAGSVIESESALLRRGEDSFRRGGAAANDKGWPRRSLAPPL